MAQPDKIKDSEIPPTVSTTSQPQPTNSTTTALEDEISKPVNNTSATPLAATESSPAPTPPALPPPTDETEPNNEEPVEDDNESNNDTDHDSAIDATSQYSDTTSLRSDMTKYRFENNRRYHAYKDGEYWGPNDETENNKLDIAHHLYLLTLDNKLFLAPISSSPQRVLDIGTGTGIWAIDFADQCPSAEVIGFDLSPTQPKWVPPNLRFEINDALESDWGYQKNSFDFIHVRALYGCIADWPDFYAKVLDNLAPGGWYQQIEMSVDPTSDDGTVTEDGIFALWGKISLEAGDKFGKDLRIHEQMKGFLEAGGFEDVVEKVYKWPIGPWSSDPHLKQLGLWNLLHWQEGIEGWCMALLTRVLGWSYTEVQAYLGRVREGLKDKNVHAYHVVKVVYGRKPMAT